MADRNEIERIAAAMHALRPAWNIRSLVTFLNKHEARPFRDLAVAAVAVAVDERTQTPNALNNFGPWWKAAQEASGTPTAAVGPGRDRCKVYGHESYPARTCQGCRTEQLGTGMWPAGTAHQDAPPPVEYADAKMRAAGDDS